MPTDNASTPTPKKDTKYKKIPAVIAPAIKNNNKCHSRFFRPNDKIFIKSITILSVKINKDAFSKHAYKTNPKHAPTAPKTAEIKHCIVRYVFVICRTKRRTKAFIQKFHKKTDLYKEYSPWSPPVSSINLPLRIFCQNMRKCKFITCKKATKKWHANLLCMPLNLYYLRVIPCPFYLLKSLEY